MTKGRAGKGIESFTLRAHQPQGQQCLAGPHSHRLADIEPWLAQGLEVEIRLAAQFLRTPHPGITLAFVLFERVVAAQRFNGVGRVNVRDIRLALAQLLRERDTQHRQKQLFGVPHAAHARDSAFVVLTHCGANIKRAGTSLAVQLFRTRESPGHAAHKRLPLRLQRVSI